MLGRRDLDDVLFFLNAYNVTLLGVAPPWVVYK